MIVGFYMWDLRVAMKPLFDTDCILDGEKIFKVITSKWSVTREVSAS